MQNGLSLLALIERRRGNLSIASAHWLKVIDLVETQRMSDRFWQDWDCIYLARVLVDLDRPETAARLVAECRADPNIISPADECVLELVEARIDRAIANRPKPEGGGAWRNSGDGH